MCRHGLSALFCLCLILLSPKIRAGEIIGSGFCNDFILTEIPVGDFAELNMPMAEMRITQKYNNAKEDGWCQAGNAQPSGDSPACQGQKIYYGHDGLDLHPLGAQAGQKDVIAIQDGLVVASHRSGAFTGWGESIVLATRANRYSKEILTFHYHHLFAQPVTDLTSRRYNACEGVPAGEAIAKEGGTPYWPTHLHLSVKRWTNLTELQNAIKYSPWNIYGQGYVYGNSSLLARNLDPEGLLYDQYSEFTDDQSNFATWQWSEVYVRAARWRGWHFGEYDGSFGVNKVVMRREAARLVKIAARIETVNSGGTNHFYDVPPTDRDFPYINTLSQRPQNLTVINTAHSCTGYGHNFCPDQEITRAEAVKMIVAGFFPGEFLELYDNWMWQAAAPLASNLLNKFTDVSPYTWYAPYVYLAWKKGLLAENGKKFHPGDPVRRAELAKWLVMADQLVTNAPAGFCQNINCAGDSYCEEQTKSCQPIPACVSQEGENCPLGGGYVLPGQGQTGPADAPDAGVQSIDASVAIATCLKGTSELAFCPDGQTPTFRTCLAGGFWTEWNPNCFDVSINDASAGTGGSSGNSTGGNAGGTSGTGGTPPETGGSPSCTVSYFASPSGASCHQNTQASGSPTLCLELQPLSGPATSWRLCKQGGTFQNNFSYQLLDQNHLSHNFGGPYVQASGTACTSWRSVSFSYFTQNSPINGAGLIVEVHSPTGCASQACTYYSGITTVYRQCE